MRGPLLPLVAVILFSLAATSQAERDLVGQYVVVKTWNVKLTENGRTLDTRVQLGDSYYVSKVEGDKIWVGQGWLQKEDVVPWDQALEYFTAEHRKDPSSANFHNRAIIHANRHELDDAIVDQTIAIKLAPGAPGYSARAAMWRDKGDFKQAISDSDEAIRLEPNRAVLYNNRANIWRKQREYEKAIADCNEAILLDPKDVTPFYNRALAWEKKGEFQKATTGFEDAIRLDPKFPWPCASLAWLKATCPEDKFRDGARAVALAAQASVLTNWKNSDVLDTLAAAYAEKGDFEAAIKWENEAIEFKLKSWSEKTTEDERARLELYKVGKPYRQTPDRKGT